MKEVALVLGKFLDFHQGHQGLIRFAQSKAEKVIVLLCQAEHDRRPVEQRQKWLHQAFGNTIDLIPFDYAAAGLDGGEESDRGISEAWAQWVDANHPEVDLIVGSEDYVRYMADYGDFDFELFDINRETFPCSSTSVNAGAYGFRSVPAKFDLSKPVVFLGPESTGKTAAAQLIGEALDLDVVYEAARKLMNSDGTFSFQDLDNFALQQQLDINETIAHSEKEQIIIDSSAFTTGSYSIQQFGEISDTVTSLMCIERDKRYNYIIFAPDVPSVDDGTRHFTQEQRMEHYAHLLDWMEIFNLPYRVVAGKDYDTRVDFAEQIILSGDYENA